MTAATAIDDYRWLVGDEAARVLAELSADPRDSLSLQRLLRKSFGGERARLAAEQLELRRRARVKFRLADRMFFTRQSLEQASDDLVAAYKATRFPGGVRVADLCCGIGGDLMALAARGPVTGIERDGAVAVLAEANLRLACREAGIAATRGAGERVAGESSRVEQADVATFSPNDFAAFHVDPDRRATGTRATRLSGCEPSESELRRWIEAKLPGAVKLAPATETPDDWRRAFEREWIGSRGECRQQVVWSGGAARFPGLRAATLVTKDASPRTIVERPNDRALAAQAWGQYLYEVESTVLAAGLADSLAVDQRLASVPGVVGYLTGDCAIDDLALTRYAIADVAPFDRRRLRDHLRTHGIGRIVVKKRGVSIEPEQVRRELSGDGDTPATIILTPWRGHVVAVISLDVR